MVKFTVPLSDILGSAYYHYELSSSDYNPSIDSTITITCTCKNVLGNPIANKTLELFQNGSSVGTATTNANGVATFSYTFSDWHWHHFSCNGATLNIQATGLKQVKQSTNWSQLTYTLYIDGASRNAYLKVTSTSSMNMGAGLDNYVINGFIPSDYRPKSSLVGVMSRYADILIWVYDNGNVGLANHKGTTLTNYQTFGAVSWSY